MRILRLLKIANMRDKSRKTTQRLRQTSMMDFNNNKLFHGGGRGFIAADKIDVDITSPRTVKHVVTCSQTRMTNRTYYVNISV